VYVPIVHHPLCNFDPCNAVIATREFRSAGEIPFAGLSRVWFITEVENGLAGEPPSGRHWKLKPGGLDSTRVGPDDSAKPNAGFKAAQARNGGEPIRTKDEAQRAVVVRFVLVVAFLAAGARVAAWNMWKAIAEPRWVIHTHKVQDYIARLNDLINDGLARLRKTTRLYDRAGPAATPAVVRADRDRHTEDRIRNVTTSIRDAEEWMPARSVATTTWVRILVTASLAVVHFLLVASFYRLIVRRQHLARRLENLAMTDPLTGLANRRALETALESAVARAKRHRSDLSVIFLDVDHFKQFNDRFGHKVGDEVLRAVARVVLSSVRTEDVAGRYGGEEFLVVLPETDEAGSVEAAERIRMSVRALDLPLPPVTISLGVATLGAQTSSVAALVATADQALYVSKQSGRDRVTHLHRELRIRGECVADCTEDLYLANAVGAPSHSEVEQPKPAHQLFSESLPAPSTP
jgi:diguanylate cyclase (GGDEF)-like protein